MKAKPLSTTQSQEKKSSTILGEKKVLKSGLPNAATNDSEYQRDLAYFREVEQTVVLSEN